MWGKSVGSSVCVLINVEGTMSYPVGNDLKRQFTSFWTSSLVGFLLGCELLWMGLG